MMRLRHRTRWWIGAGAVGGVLLFVAGVVLPPSGQEESVPGARQESGRRPPGAIVDRGALTPPATLSGQLASGGAHLYRITFEADQVLRARLAEGEIWVAVFGPEARLLLEEDRQNAGPEPLIVVARVVGTYRFEVRLAEDAKDGGYEIEVDEPRPASDRDRRYAAALEASFAARRAASPAQAIAQGEEALAQWRALDVPYRQARTLRMLGELWEKQKDRRRQVECNEQAIRILRTLGELKQVARLLNQTGHAYRALGEPHEALAAYSEALAVAQVIADREWEAHASNNLGYAHKSLGHIQEALTFYEQAKKIYHDLGLGSYEGNTLHNLGVIYNSLGKPQEALDRLERAAELLSSKSNLRQRAAVLTTIGNAHNMLGNYNVAIDAFHQALELHETLDLQDGTDHLRSKATTLDSLATAHREIGELPQALAAYEEALEIWKRIDYPLGIAKTTSHIGWLNLEWNRPERALEHLEEARPLLAELQDRDGEAHALMGIARVLRHRGDLVNARARLEEALDVVESVRRTAHSQDLRSSFIALRHDYYELYVDLLIEMHDADPKAGYDALALAATERARARSLLEPLFESGADLRQGVPGELVAREEELHQQMNDREAERRRLLAAAAAPAEVGAVEKAQRDLAMQYERLQAEIRRRSPAYAGLTRPQPLSAPEIRQLLDDETLLLAYYLGDERSFLWLVSREAVTCYQLPRRTVIEKEARQTAEWLQNRSERFGWYSGVQAAAELSEMVLGPVGGRLGQKRLLVVSDGMLAYVPFASLPAPRPAGAASEGPAPPLISDHEIVSLPSASVLAVLRQRSAGRKAAPKTVAVVADPIFTAADPRVGTAQERVVGTRPPASVTEAELAAAAEEWPLESFDRIPFSRREAEAILALVPPEQSLRALDFDATRELVTDGRLAEYRILHFATHAMLHAEHPELSGLMLSLVDERGAPRDGRLYMHQIYGLDLPAELVVLSACRTALGEQVRGEGIVGLTRGFMYAGASRVLVSLWGVNDRATAELMAHFYQGMLAEGLTPAAALRRAQRAMLDHPHERWRAPYYWAGFLLQGQWQ